MDIQLVRNCKYQPVRMIDENVVLEIQEISSEYRIPYVRLYQYELDTNTRIELEPKLNKIQYGTILYAQNQTPYTYFVALCADIPYLYRIHNETLSSEKLCELSGDLLTEHGIRYKLIIVSQEHVLIQKEIARSNLTQTYEVFCEFELQLYSVKEDKFYTVQDVNLITNGIETVIPVSDHSCIIKMGYNLLEDARFEKLERIQMPVESLCLVKPQQLISDIRIGQTNIIYEYIEQAFHSTTIPNVQYSDDYLIYSVVNHESAEEVVTFYQLSTKERVTCLNKNVRTIEQLSKARVINSVPIIMLKKEKKTSIFNVEKQGEEFVASFGEDIVFAVGTLLITKKQKKKLFSKNTQTIFQFYQYPKKEVVYHIVSNSEEDLIAFLNVGEIYYAFFK